MGKKVSNMDDETTSQLVLNNNQLSQSVKKDQDQDQEVKDEDQVQDKEDQDKDKEDQEIVKFVEGRNGLIVPDPEHNESILQSVKWIREQIKMEIEQNPDLYILSDLDYLMTEDYFIRRFLYPHDLDPVPALEQLKNSLIWRKEVGFENASDERFPAEFFKIGALFPYLQDRDGTNVLYMRFKVYKKLNILDQAIKQFVVYNLDKLDKLGKKERSWGVIFDTRGAGLAQVDFDMLIFLFKTVKQYFPWGLKYVCIYELPWLLYGGWKVTQKLLPSDATRLFKFYSKDNICELIDPENLPDFMGGTATLDYRAVPEGCQSAEIIAAKEMGLTPEEVKAVIKHFEKHFEENKESTSNDLNK